MKNLYQLLFHSFHWNCSQHNQFLPLYHAMAFSSVLKIHQKISFCWISFFNRLLQSLWAYPKLLQLYYHILWMFQKPRQLFSIAYSFIKHFKFVNKSPMFFANLVIFTPISLKSALTWLSPVWSLLALISDPYPSTHPLRLTPNSTPRSPSALIKLCYSSFISMWYIYEYISLTMWTSLASY